jgi:DNA polymerase elongation subunit (family B)
MKILVNSAYGYMGAVGLTRCSDVAAANEVTRQGRAVLGLLCRELAARGATLLEADTDGVYFAVPSDWDEADERRVVGEVAALLPALVRLEVEGRYAAMLSHETKNYALLGYDGQLILRGVAFRSSRVEPFGATFLRRAIARLLADDVPGVRAAYVEMASALRRRALPTAEVAARVRLTKTPDEYQATRATRREASYEAALASGMPRWERGTQVAVYRATGGRPALAPESEPETDTPRDYDTLHYARLLRETYAARLVRAFSADDYAALFDNPEQPSLFAPAIETIAPVLTHLMDPPEAESATKGDGDGRQRPTTE